MPGRCCDRRSPSSPGEEQATSFDAGVHRGPARLEVHQKTRGNRELRATRKASQTTLSKTLCAALYLSDRE